MLKRTKTAAAVIILMTLAPCGSAGEVPLDRTKLWQMAMYIGDWEINETWEDGSELWSRNEFRVGLGGVFVEIRTYAKDDNDEVYQRYFTIFAHDKVSDTVRSYGFTNDGTVTVVDNVKLEGSVTDAAITSQWGSGDSQFRQTIQIVSRNAYSWKVWSGNGTNWNLIMDGTWRRAD